MKTDVIASCFQFSSDILASLTGAWLARPLIWPCIAGAYLRMEPNLPFSERN